MQWRLNSLADSIKVIKEQLAHQPSAKLLQALAADSRKGVQAALQQYQHQQDRLAERQQALQARLVMEQQLWPQYPLIAGIDEVGRGPLAGPVVTAAVILPHDFNVLDVNDSKQLSAKKRQSLYLQICAAAIDVSIGIANAAMIDRENIYHATELAMAQAVNQLYYRPQYLLVDAMHVPVDLVQRKIIKGDQKSASVAAASIVAKQVRDHLMTMYDRIYPGYDFKDNAGYGTKKHLAGLAEFGSTPIHRQSFSPVKQYNRF